MKISQASEWQANQRLNLRCGGPGRAGLAGVTHLGKLLSPLVELHDDVKAPTPRRDLRENSLSVAPIAATVREINNSLAHRTLGIVLSCMERHQKALSAVRRARELDPLDFVHQALSARIAFLAGDYPSAVEIARHVLDPEFWVGYYQLAQALANLTLPSFYPRPASSPTDVGSLRPAAKGNT